MSSGGTESSMHFDTSDNLLVQLKGSRRLILADPRYSKLAYMDFHDK